MTERKLNIGLDYDGTISAEPALWRMFVTLAKARGHTVHVVTMRYAEEMIDHEFSILVEGRVNYTGYKAKKPYMEAKGIKIDIWIDDHPAMIVNDLVPVPYLPGEPNPFLKMSVEELKEVVDNAATNNVVIGEQSATGNGGG